MTTILQLVFTVKCILKQAFRVTSNLHQPFTIKNILQQTSTVKSILQQPLTVKASCNSDSPLNEKYFVSTLHNEKYYAMVLLFTVKGILNRRLQWEVFATGLWLKGILNSPLHRKVFCHIPLKCILQQALTVKGILPQVIYSEKVFCYRLYRENMWWTYFTIQAHYELTCGLVRSSLGYLTGFVYIIRTNKYTVCIIIINDNILCACNNNLYP